LISHLDRDNNIVSLGFFVCFQLKKQLDLGDTNAAEFAVMMIGRSDKTVCTCRSQFFEDDSEIPQSKQHKYQQPGRLWVRKKLTKKAVRFIRENTNVEGQPNLMIPKFCEWVDEDLPNKTLEAGFPGGDSKEVDARVGN